MAKSSQAFRTISEVAQDLDVPQHVLRFWESKFSQVRPMKRGGGRRYYRPEDVDVLKGIRTLLYDDGFTIKGVQKVFRERGVRYVAETGQKTGIGPDGSSDTSKTEHLDSPAGEPDHAPPALQATGGQDAEVSSSIHAKDEDATIVRGLTENQREVLERILGELSALKDRLDKYRSKRNSQRVVSQINLAKRSDLSKGSSNIPKDAAAKSRG